MTPFTPNPLPLTQTIETKKVLKKTIQANRALARLNGVALIIPNQNILIKAFGGNLLTDEEIEEIRNHPEHESAGRIERIKKEKNSV